MSPLMGLVLVGGESRRMGEDKSLISYHGIPQWKFLREILAPFCKEVFLGAKKVTQDAPTLVDVPGFFGPGASIRAVFEKFPDSAWFFVACDLPRCQEAVSFLVSHRNPNMAATYFCGEPMFSIWEHPTLKAFVDSTEESPLRFLQTKECETLVPLDPLWLFNVNTPEDSKHMIELTRGAAHHR